MSEMLMETYLRQQVDKGEYGVAIIQAQIALDIADYIEKQRQPTIEPEPQWIPCSERLPDKKDDYLCSYSGCAVADICEYDPDRNEWGFFYDGGWKVVSNVTAWMPLPGPYKGGQE